MQEDCGDFELTMTCDLCKSDGGEVVWRSTCCRVVLVDDGRFPGYSRLIWNEHVKESSDLSPSDQNLVFRLLMAIEAALRKTVDPDKVNLASFGNMTPHLHWHVIPRWHDDSHFPQAIWAEAERDAAPRVIDLAALREKIRELCSRAERVEGMQ